MGSASDWFQILTLALVFGGGNFLWSLSRRSQLGIKPALAVKEIVGWALLGLCFGMTVIFRWHAFGYPLIFVTLPALAVGFLTGPYGLKLLQRVRTGPTS